jgi:hypothetical protein
LSITGGVTTLSGALKVFLLEAIGNGFRKAGKSQRLGNVARNSELAALIY